MTAYQQQLRDKTDYLKKLFQGLEFPEIEVFESPEQHYRMRAEFRIWHEGGEMFYAMFERGQKASGASLIRCDQFPAASESINALMPKLIEAAAQNSELKNRWYAVEFLSALSGEMLVTMIYHKKLGEAWQRAAETLARELGIHIIGRSRGQKIFLTQDYITEELNVNGKTFRYRQVEGSFTRTVEYRSQPAGQHQNRPPFCGGVYRSLYAKPRISPPARAGHLAERLWFFRHFCRPAPRRRR